MSQDQNQEIKEIKEIKNLSDLSDEMKELLLGKEKFHKELLSAKDDMITHLSGKLKKKDYEILLLKNKLYAIRMTAEV